MEFSTAMQELEAAGTAQNRKVYARHGVKDPQFGVSFAALKALAKKIKKDHDLAGLLWATRNHDARVLATMIADPKTLSGNDLDSWAKDLDNYVLMDAFSQLAAKTPYLQEKAEAWIGSEAEFVAAAGYNLLGSLAGGAPELDDAYFESHLATIEEEIHDRKNRVRHSMNQAVICIGIRNEHLKEKAIATARRIGTVEVDHGETGCKTPEAEPYIEKALEYRRKQAGKKAKREAAKKKAKAG